MRVQLHKALFSLPISIIHWFLSTTALVLYDIGETTGVHIGIWQYMYADFFVCVSIMEIFDSQIEIICDN